MTKPRFNTFRIECNNVGLQYDTTKAALRGDCFGIRGDGVEDAARLGAICEELGVDLPDRFEHIGTEGMKWRARFESKKFNFREASENPLYSAMSPESIAQREDT